MQASDVDDCIVQQPPSRYYFPSSCGFTACVCLAFSFHSRTAKSSPSTIGEGRLLDIVVSAQNKSPCRLSREIWTLGDEAPPLDCPLSTPKRGQILRPCVCHFRRGDVRPQR